MKPSNLKATRYKTLELDLRDVNIMKGRVVGNNKTSSKVHVPTEWKGKRVYVVVVD